jgi:hypothetical protein
MADDISTELKVEAGSGRTAEDDTAMIEFLGIRVIIARTSPADKPLTRRSRDVFVIVQTDRDPGPWLDMRLNDGPVYTGDEVDGIELGAFAEGALSAKRGDTTDDGARVTDAQVVE